MAGTHGYQQVFTESVSNVTATNSVDLGTRRIESGCEYVYVYNDGGTTALIGYGLIMSLHSGFSCSFTAVLGDVCFGVVKNTDLEPSQYGWACVKGYAHLLITTDTDTSVAGAPLFLNTGGGFGVITTGATGTTMGIGRGEACATALGTIGTNQTGVCYVNCAG